MIPTYTKKENPVKWCQYKDNILRISRCSSTLLGISILRINVKISNYMLLILRLHLITNTYLTEASGNKFVHNNIIKYFHKIWQTR